MEFLDANGRWAARILAAAVVVAAAWLVFSLATDEHREEPRLAVLPDHPSVVVNLAGVFPEAPAEPLAKPLGIAVTEQHVYVAEAEGGRIACFSPEGRPHWTYDLPPTQAGARPYPMSLAVIDDGGLAVVDGAGNRVLLLDLSDEHELSVAGILGSGYPSEAPRVPTAVAYGEGQLFVADSARREIRIYDENGRLVRSIGDTLDPPLTHVGAMALRDDVLIVTDGNTGRIASFDLSANDRAHRIADGYQLPRGVTALGAGLAVVDVLGLSVDVYGANEKVFLTIDESSVDAGLLIAPEQVAWRDEPSRLYVTDALRGQVIVFNVRHE